MRINLNTLGCRLNEAELENWARDFQARGHTIINDPDSAELLIVNTCAVTREATKKSRQLIRRIQRKNPAAKLVVSGCYATLDHDLDNKIQAIDLIIPNRDKDRLAGIVLDKLGSDDPPSGATLPEQTGLAARGRNRAFIKIQDGCRHRCTFCTVTLARGEERSRRVTSIVDEINTLHRRNVNEIVLTGVHIGGYGSDIDSNLTELISAVLADTDVPRVRLASIEPWELSDQFIRLFENKRLMPHMHLPLQSGSDRVLKKMGRRCTTAAFAALVTQLRTGIADFNLTTDMIVGFPGETDEEWRKSINFVEKIGFSDCHIFPYSQRQGTKAADMPEQIPLQIKKQRSRELHALSNKMRQCYLQQQVGKTLSVLWETKNSDRQWSGYTANYIRAEHPFPDSENPANQVTKVDIIGLSRDHTRLAVMPVKTPRPPASIVQG